MSSNTTHASPSQAVAADFVELGEDVSGSPLWNKDLAPTTLAQRTWSTWNIAALWIGMSVVISTYTIAGGMIADGMTWWQAMGTVLLGNALVLIPMCLNAHAGTKYGLSFPVLLRSSFGTVGANVPAIMRAIVACGWFGIQTWIGGMAIDGCLRALSPGWASQPGHLWIAFFAFWAIQVYFVVRGLEGIKRLQSFSAPLLLLGGIALLWWATREAGGMGRVLSESDRLHVNAKPFWSIFPAYLTASVSYWATLSLNIPDFTRFAKSQRSQMVGQALGLPLTMAGLAFIGVAVTSATMIIYGRAIADPVELLGEFKSLPVILFATVIIFLAQLSTNMAANVVSPSNDFSNLNPRVISYVTGGLITAVIGVLMMPWKLYGSLGAYIFTWLVGYGVLMGAIGGIMICDYWIIRKRKLDLAELFNPRGQYSYGGGGINWRAMAALAIAISPCVPGFIRAATTPGGNVADANFFDRLYHYAYFVTFGLGMLVYGVLMWGQRRGTQES
ncbi:MAG TPA: NCS1 family nucleobase:cation symporter-1 [Tepidisphaeraceae bacterium]|nr:NCS1 family nucleobase:cation symporter-1 [Tepidisphaeraceae bacterium]